MRLALHGPDQAGNVGAVLRLGACLGTPVEIIRPTGFALSERSLRRAAMDYAALVELTVHDDWQAFAAAAGGRRLVLLTTSGEQRLDDFAFTKEDVLLLGSESAGVPADVHAAVDRTLRIPLAPGARSLNLAVAAAIALGAALRQTGGLPR